MGKMSNDSVAIDKYERRKIESRQRIKTAALQLFSENGVEGTSVAAIIRKAGIAHQTFFNHFPSRNHLLMGISDDVTEVAYAIFAEADNYELEPYEKLEFAFVKIAKGMSKFTRGEKQLVQYCLIGIPEGPDDQKAQQAIKLRSAIDKILKEAKKAGQLSSEFPYEVLLDMTLGIYTSTLTSWAMQDDYPLVPKVRQAVKFIHNSVFDAGQANINALAKSS
jgi:AcrR family transcriptional regulator